MKEPFTLDHVLLSSIHIPLKKLISIMNPDTRSTLSTLM